MKVSNDWLYEFFKYHDSEPSERERSEAEYYGHVHWQIAVPNDLPPRDKSVEYLLNIGRGMLDSLFTKGDLEAEGEIDFFYPERWLSIQEQYSFISLLMRCDSFKRLTKVRIVTQSPFIVGNFMLEQIRILTFGDKK